MESSGSSFIPQRPTRGKVAAKSFRKIYVLSYVSYLIFFTTLLAVGGVFFYKFSLQAQLQGLKEDLVAQKNLFNQTDLDRIRNLDNRVDAATQLVNSHASLLTIFDALAKNVAEPVQFLSFNYDRREDVNSPNLSLSARAQSFDEVIFQKKIFTDAPLTNNLFVNNVSLTTQPIDQERLELGIEQVVNINMSVDLALSDVNFTGYSARSADGGTQLIPIGSSDSDTVEDSDTTTETEDTVQSSDPTDTSDTVQTDDVTDTADDPASATTGAPSSQADISASDAAAF